MKIRGRRILLTIILVVAMLFAVETSNLSNAGGGGSVRDMTKLETIDFLMDRYRTVQKEGSIFKSNKQEVEDIQVQLWDNIGELEDKDIRASLMEQVISMTKSNKRNRVIKLISILSVTILITAGGFVFVRKRMSDINYEEDAYYDDEDE